MEVVAAGLADRRALRDLVEAYAFAVDRRDTARFIALFTAAATLTVHDASGTATGGYAGRDELAELPGRLSRYDRTLHLVHNHEVAISGTDATGEVYCVAHHVIGTRGDCSDRVLTIRYIDQYVRQPDRWLFQAREVRVQWTEERIVHR